MRLWIFPVELVVILFLTATKLYSAPAVKYGSTQTVLPCLRVSTPLFRMRVMTTLGSALPAYPYLPVLLLSVVLVLVLSQILTAQL